VERGLHGADGAGPGGLLLVELEAGVEVLASILLLDFGRNLLM
jgi:hypothetical protein